MGRVCQTRRSPKLSEHATRKCGGYMGRRSLLLPGEVSGRVHAWTIRAVMYGAAHGEVSRRHSTANSSSKEESREGPNVSRPVPRIFTSFTEAAENERALGSLTGE